MIQQILRDHPAYSAERQALEVRKIQDDEANRLRNGEKSNLFNWLPKDVVKIQCDIKNYYLPVHLVKDEVGHLQGRFMNVTCQKHLAIS